MISMDEKIIEVFTDGSSTVYHDTNNLRYGGIGVFFGPNSKNNVSTPLVGKEVSNQRAELGACVAAIKKYEVITKELSVTYNNPIKLLIITDSMYTINCITQWCPTWKKNGWRRKAKSTLDDICNLDLIKRLYQLYNKHNKKTKLISFTHVRSHQKEPLDKESNEWKMWYGNKQADSLAGAAMEQARDSSFTQ